MRDKTPQRKEVFRFCFQGPEILYEYFLLYFLSYFFFFTPSETASLNMDKTQVMLEIGCNTCALGVPSPAILPDPVDVMHFSRRSHFSRRRHGGGGRDCCVPEGHQSTISHSSIA